MSAVKFTFDTVFSGDEDVASESARARRRQTLSQAEIEAIEAKARADGASAGEVRALEAIAAGSQDAAIAVREAVARADGQAQALRAEAARIGLAAARKLAGAALDGFAAQEIEEVLRQAMHQAIGEPRLTLRAAPDVAAALAPRIEEIAHHEGFDGRVAVSADPGLANADCRIEWRGGGIERLQTYLDGALEALLSRHFPQTPTISLIKE